NNFRTSPTGMLGVSDKAITAVDHFLLARFFMHRSVYYHKTTFGLEEACRQLLRRVRDKGEYGMPMDGNALTEFVTGPNLGQFTDAFVDTIVEKAAQDQEPVIRALADCIRRRRPPKLLKEVLVLEQHRNVAHAGVVFKKDCKHQLQHLANSFSLPIGRFLVCETRPLSLEERGALLTEEQARSLEPQAKEEIIKVFVGNQSEPVSVVNIPHSIIHLCSNCFFQAFRLYFVPDDSTDDELVKKLRKEVSSWGEPS